MSGTIPRPPSPPERRPQGPLAPLRASLALLLVLAVGAGIVYPGAIALVAQTAVPGTANGSLLHYPNGTAYGSSLLGENISDPALFWLRPSLIDWQTFNASGGSNGPGNEVPYGPTDPALVNATREYIDEYFNTTGNLSAAELANLSVPLDLLSPSASGLDPDLTPASVLVQIPRVAHYSGINQSVLLPFVLSHVQAPWLGIFGPRYINVVQLDVDLLPMLPAGSNPIPFGG
jgi:K+-transporting ATPase ATPase C chain